MNYYFLVYLPTWNLQNSNFYRIVDVAAAVVVVVVVVVSAAERSAELFSELRQKSLARTSARWSWPRQNLKLFLLILFSLFLQVIIFNCESLKLLFSRHTLSNIIQQEKSFLLNLPQEFYTRNYLCTLLTNNIFVNWSHECWN